MIALNQWTQHVAAKREAERRGLRVPVDAAKRADAIRAESVLAHPGWTMLTQYIHEAVVKARTRLDVLSRDLVERNLVAQERDWMLLEARDLIGFIRALTEVTTIIPTLIERGTEPVEARGGHASP